MAWWNPWDEDYSEEKQRKKEAYDNIVRSDYMKERFEQTNDAMESTVKSGLRRQNQRARNELRTRGVEPPEQPEINDAEKRGDQSLLMETFDVLSRPLYAVAEGAERFMNEEQERSANWAENNQERIQQERQQLASEGVDVSKDRASDLAYQEETSLPQRLLDQFGSVDEAVQGAKSGFMGKDKETFSRLLSKEDTPGDHPVAEAGVGFAADVLLDPLTYTGAGLMKKGFKEAAEAAGMRASLKARHSKDAQTRMVHELAKRRQAIDAGVENAPTRSQAIENARRAAGRDAFQAEKARILAENPGKLGIRFGKKTFGSKRAYDAATGALNRVASTPPVRRLDETFRTSSVLPGKLKRFQREAHGSEAADFEGLMKGFRNLTKKTTDAQRRALFDSIEDGGYTDAMGNYKFHSDLSGQKTKDGVDLGEIQHEIKRMNDQMFDFEEAYGILSPDQYRDGYMHHVLTPKGQRQAKKFAKNREPAMQPGEFGAAEKRIFQTGKEAQEAGVDVSRDVSEAMAKRVADHVRKISEYDFVRRAADEYGVTPKTSKQVNMVKPRGPNGKGGLGFKRVTHEALQNDKHPTYVPPQVADAIEGVSRLYKNPEEFGKFFEAVNKAQNPWKFVNTVLNPTHHLRNLIGDSFNSFLGGVKNPESYRRAGKMVAGSEGGIGAGGQHFSYPEIWNLYSKKGAKSGFIREEFGSASARKNPFTRLEENVREFSEKREDWVRGAHFIDKFKKYMDEQGPVSNSQKHKIADQAASDAAADTRKWLIDYGDFTPFEKKYAKTAQPFYSFMRKNIPLQLEAAFMQPGKLAALPKAKDAVSRSMGKEPTDEMRETSWMDDAVPHWIKGMGGTHIGQIAGITDNKSPAFSTFQMPTADLNRLGGGTTGSPLQDLLSSSSPFITAPIEAAMGKDAYTGAPIDNPVEYLANQTVPSRVAYRLADEGRSGQEKRRELFNWLTPLGIQQATPRRQEAELRRRNDSLQKLLRQAEEEAYLNGSQ
jgi:hypothetical protein